MSTTVLTAGCSFPEGPVSHADEIYWVEYGRDAVLRHPAEAEVLWHEPGSGPNGLIRIDAGFLVACYRSGSVVEIDDRGAERRRWASDDIGPLACPNDLVAHDGGHYVTFSGRWSLDHQPEGSIGWLDPSGRLRRVADGLSYPNGLCVVGDQLIVGETLGNRVLSFTIGVDHALGAPAVLRELGDVTPAEFATPWVGPDGLKSGPDASVWLAHHGAGQLVVLERSGELRTVIPVPSMHVTNLAFHRGGVVVTGIDDAEPPGFAGTVYFIDL